MPKNYPRYPIDAIKFPDKFPNGYTRNPDATGLCAENFGLKTRNKFILSEWQREPMKSVWGHDKEVSEFIENSDKDIKSCKSIFIELKKIHPAHINSDSYHKCTPRRSFPEFTYQKPNGERRLLYIPEVKFKLYIGWYHRVDGEIYTDSYAHCIPNPITYENKWLDNDKCALEAIKEAIMRMKVKCGKETIYLMQLERWRKYNNPV